jgi:hypothetical protein
MSPHVRTVATPNGRTAVQVVWSNRHGRRDITQIGTGRDQAQVELLKAKAAQVIAAGQGELDLGLGGAVEAALPIASTRMGHLADLIDHAYDQTGLNRAVPDDGVFRQLVAARIIEPTSKQDSLRVLGEAGLAAPSYATVKRRLAGYAQDQFRDRLAGVCAAEADLGPNSLVLFDCTTLRYECHEADEFRVPGYSKERRLEPQIAVALLCDRRGFPLSVKAFPGNTAETKTILPVIADYAAAHRLRDVTVVADAGMLSEKNLHAIADGGWSFVVGLKIPEVPFQVVKWAKEHPGEQVPDGLVLVQDWPKGSKSKTQAWRDVYQYRAARARRTLRGIDEQVAKAAKAVRGEVPVKRNRFVAIKGAELSVNTVLEAKTRALAGWKGYAANLGGEPAEFVIAA